MLFVRGNITSVLDIASRATSVVRVVEHKLKPQRRSEIACHGPKIVGRNRPLLHCSYQRWAQTNASLCHATGGFHPPRISWISWYARWSEGNASHRGKCGGKERATTPHESTVGQAEAEEAPGRPHRAAAQRQWPRALQQADTCRERISAEAPQGCRTESDGGRERSTSPSGRGITPRWASQPARTQYQIRNLGAHNTL